MDYDFLKVGDGSGDAAQMHVQSTRSIGSTTIDVDSVSGVPAQFIATYGTLLPSGLIDPSTKCDFYGHLSGSDLIIDGFLPGSTDDGNIAGQVVIIKPNTHWANQVAQFIMNAKDFGTPEAAWFAALTASSLTTTGDISTAAALKLTSNTPTIEATGSNANISPNIKSKGTGAVQADGLNIHKGYDYVDSGLVITPDAAGSSLAASMTAGVVVINGKPISIGSVSARAYTASKDTYVDIDNSGTITYTEVANNAASPAIAANSIRIGIVVTGGSNIANSGSINQGQLSAALPVNSNQYYQGFDSLGNPIYNIDPIEVSCRRTGAASPVPTSLTDVAGVTSTFTLTKRSRVEIHYHTHIQLNSGGTRNTNLQLYIDGTLVDGLYAQDNPGATETHLDSTRIYSTFLTAGAHTVKLRCVANTGGTIALDGTGFIMKIR